MRKIIISVGLLIIGLSLIAVALTFDQDLEHAFIVFFLKWQQQFAFS